MRSFTRIFVDTYCEVFEENIAPFVLNICEDNKDTNDHTENDGDNNY